MLAFSPGDPMERRARVLLLDRATGLGTDLVVSITGDRVVTQQSIDAGSEGHVPILDQEFEDIEAFLLESSEWLDAMKKRNLNPTDVRAVPLSAGVFGHEDEVGRRVVRVLAFYQYDKADLPWAHPIDGVVAYVDLTARRVTKVIDEFDLAVPAERGEWDAEPHAVPARTDLKPIEITQPEGPSFEVNGNQITWADWTFRFGFDIREGLTLHQVAIGGRPVVYRASIAEMVGALRRPVAGAVLAELLRRRRIPARQNANSLELGCDCLGEITYFDADDRRRAGPAVKVLKNAICVHEEDFGVLWKHTDMFNGIGPRPVAPGDS